MVGCTRRPGKRAKVPFADPPWSERSDEWQIRDRQVPAHHPARVVVEAMKQLDLTPLFASYVGAGSPPIRPDLMLAIVLIEIRLGRPQPSQWFRDARENIVIQWAGFLGWFVGGGQRLASPLVCRQFPKNVLTTSTIAPGLGFRRLFGGCRWLTACNSTSRRRACS